MTSIPGPVLAAPMAGGAGTPALLAACGGGFLAAGYLTPAALASRIASVRAAVRAGGGWFGVNLFAPPEGPVGDLAAYADELAPEFAVYDLAPAVPAGADDDHWAEKLDLLLTDPVPAVSFTFGIPSASTVAALRRAGTLVLQTVTTPPEAAAAAAAGVDALVVQAPAAGGHSATLSPSAPPTVPVPLPDLVAAVRAAVPLPVVAAGGIATSADVAAALHTGATATMVGTALLRTDEAGTSAPHRAALESASGWPAHGTVVTRAFTGRPARALRNGFIDRHDATAPLGYPQVHHLTAPLRRAAAAAGDTDRVHLWAGTGHRQAATGPAAAVIATLTASL
ncbi:nitronate monooxygenase [Dactylosporangium sp. CA-152071]|uniref:nitronate monooxygenase n=1 Tax=Dactylosporangium sp. CA-152071 TaxID=3239933 RepID=UPI003D906466